MMHGHLYFQDSASPLMAALTKFHDEAMLPILFIMSYVGIIMLIMTLKTSHSTNLKESKTSQTIEYLWTIWPGLVLVTLALPSLQALYLLDSMSDPILTIKTSGHQWYWSYEYCNFNIPEFDSYMIPTNKLNLGDLRLLEVDNRLILPTSIEISMLVTSNDVIHAWTIPSLGVKTDAIPGRLNQIIMNISRPGTFYGQCSEICGANHSFMPIAVEAIPPNNWISWVLKNTMI